MLRKDLIKNKIYGIIFIITWSVDNPDQNGMQRSFYLP